MIAKKSLNIDSELIAFLFGILALAVSAQISIPLRPVPISMQTFALLYIGIVYSRACAIASVSSYVLLGALGFPLFTNFLGGLDVILSPRGGYIIGFVFAILTMVNIRGFIGSKFIDTFVTCIVGSMVVFVFGVSWLAAFVGIEKAIIVGFVPFILPGIIKALILSMALRYSKL